ncbi:hypothetical protein CMK20_14635 [Candidatus Poribacteria bacterium]|nr:hypothetical protein [Candidatus Poribacteria bacterium]MCH2576001.1 PHP domain-containing protein [Candidatus Poribacteria bacterium]|tara:strand:+ start:111 stop:1784 length:1674 start_codon:yes stop_codon:yes gene_type:complete
MNISQIFENISQLLYIRGDKSYRVQSYQRVADIIGQLTHSIEAENEISYLSEMLETGQLRTIKGIGDSAISVITDLLQKGTSNLYEELKLEVGTEVLELLKVRGIGIKMATQLYRHAKIHSLSDLRLALSSNRLKEIKGLGTRKIQSIETSLNYLEIVKNLRPLGIIRPIADRIVSKLKGQPGVEKIEITGEVRRGEEMVSQLELLLIGSPDNVARVLKDHLKDQVINATNISGTINQFPVVIHFTNLTSMAWDWIVTTGPEDHVQQLSIPGSDLSTEREIYLLSGLPYIAPELRRTTEFANPIEDKLPHLVELTDIRSDLHMHTNWSDGLNTIQEMVNQAKSLGYSHISITDHSKSSVVANGLDPNRLRKQIEEVRIVNNRTDGITVLAGSEVDILKNGDLDYDDELLAELDIVIASIHSNFELSESQMTQRIIRAIENPFTMMIGHPTGRLLGSRPGYAFDLPAILDVAADCEVALEINASINRLDLEPDSVILAKQKGVQLSVNTDAHSLPDLQQMKWGITVARRGWLEPSDIINTLTLDQFFDWKNGRQQSLE